MHLALLLFTSTAFAVCVDNDSDTYSVFDSVGCPSANDRSDCNDGNASIHPNGVEVGGNWVDEDCDTKDGVSRKYVDDFTSNAAGDWTVGAGSASWASGDHVTISGSSNIQLTGDFEALRGKPHVVVDVDSIAGTSSCSIKLTAGDPPTGASGAITTTQTISTSGTQAFYFSSSLDAPLIVTEVMFSCGAGHSMEPTGTPSMATTSTSGRLSIRQRGMCYPSTRTQTWTST